MIEFVDVSGVRREKDSSKGSHGKPKAV